MKQFLIENFVTIFCFVPRSCNMLLLFKMICKQTSLGQFLIENLLTIFVMRSSKMSLNLKFKKIRNGILLLAQSKNQSYRFPTHFARSHHILFCFVYTFCRDEHHSSKLQQQKLFLQVQICPGN